MYWEPTDQDLAELNKLREEVGLIPVSPGTIKTTQDWHRYCLEIDALSESEEYLLQNCDAGYLGNSPLFWQKGGSGYTQWIDDARRWTREEALRQIRATRGTHRWLMWPVSQIELAARRTVDIQDLRNVESTAWPAQTKEQMEAAYRQQLRKCGFKSWTKANERRCQLIDEAVESGAESDELKELQILSRLRVRWKTDDMVRRGVRNFIDSQEV